MMSEDPTGNYFISLKGPRDAFTINQECIDEKNQRQVKVLW